MTTEEVKRIYTLDSKIPIFMAVFWEEASPYMRTFRRWRAKQCFLLLFVADAINESTDRIVFSWKMSCVNQNIMQKRSTHARQGSAMYRFRITRLLILHLSLGCPLLPTKLQPAAHMKWSLETPESLLPITDRCGICYYTVRNTVELHWSGRWLSRSALPFG